MDAIQCTAEFAFLFLLVSVFLQHDLCRAEILIETLPTKDTETTYLGRLYKSKFASHEFFGARFLGIPFAQTPVRFSKPVLSTSEIKIFYATRFGDICQQPIFDSNTCEARQIMSEDCLSLNIYVPIPSFTEKDLKSSYTETATSNAADSKSSESTNVRNSGKPLSTVKLHDLPSNGTKFAVMIYFHGRSFLIGSGNCYDGSNLAGLGNIIVVTVNYRLGNLGFLSTNDDVIPGNLGLWDQHVAIQWVKKHIDAFGGDPERITVAGESAGSYSAIFQALYPGNHGLFQRVIAQSGTPAAFKSVNMEPYITTHLVARSFNCTLTGTKQDIKDCLMSQAAEDLANAHQQSLVPGSLAIQPSIDHIFVHEDTYAVLSQIANPQQTSKPAAPSQLSEKDLLIGLNSGDGDVALMHLSKSAAENNSILFKELTLHVPTKREVKEGIIPQYFQTKRGEAIEDILIKSVIDRYNNWERPESDASFNIDVIEMLTDIYFAIPALETASVHAQAKEPTSKAVNKSSNSAEFPTNKTPAIFTGNDRTSHTHNISDNKHKTQGSTFVYKFSLPIPRSSIFVPWFIGSGHGTNTEYVFGTNRSFTEDDLKLSKNIITYWSNFVKTGDPNKNVDHAETKSPAPVKISNPNLLHWPEFNNQDESYLEISSSLEVKNRMRASYRHFWSNYIPRLQHRLRELVNVTKVSGNGRRIGPLPENNRQSILAANFYLLITLASLTLGLQAIFCV